MNKLLTSLGLSAIFMTFNASANIHSIDVFTTTDNPAILHANYPAVVHQLDAAEKMEDAFFGELPADPEEAEKIAKSRFASADFAQMQSQLVDAYNGLLTAWSLKLTKYPAVVINRQAVIYGTADVGYAVNLWEAHNAQ